MSEGNPMEARITELEIKISYTEDAVDALNRTIFRQQQQIDQLLGKVMALRDRVHSAPPNGRRSPRDELPPHY